MKETERNAAIEAVRLYSINKQPEIKVYDIGKSLNLETKARQLVKEFHARWGFSQHLQDILDGANDE